MLNYHGNIWTWLCNAINNIIAWGQNTYNTAIQWVSSTINSITNWFSELPGRIWTWLIGAVNKVAEWGKDIAKKGEEGAKDLYGKIIKTIEELPSKVQEIGKNIVEGLWNGIAGAGDWIKTQVGTFSKGILDGMKESLGIHSPSKLFRDEVGKYIALGVGEGFTKNINKVYKDMQNKITVETNKMTGKLSTDIRLASEAENVNGRISGLSTTTTNNNYITVQFYPQKITDTEMDRALNYIDKKYGLLY